MADLTPGRSVAQRFELITRLDSEGDCERWLARDAERNEGAELTFFRQLSLSAVDARTRAEIGKLEKLVHPHIVPMLGVFECDGVAVLAHGGTDGKELAVAAGGDYEHTLSLLYPVIGALAFLHGIGIAHGALDTTSLRLYEDGQARLANLGKAHLLDCGSGHTARVADDVRALGRLLENLTGANVGAPVPPGLKSLLAATQTGTGETPGMQTVLRTVASVLGMEDDPAGVPAKLTGAAAGPVTALGRGPSTAAPAQAPARGRATSVPVFVALPVMLVLLALVVAVFFYLPQRAPEAGAASVTSSTASAARRSGQQSNRERVAQDAAPFAAAEQARQRQEAQDAAMALLRSLVALEERAAETWAQEDFVRARQAGEEGDALYRAQSYEPALATYQSGLALAEALISRSGEVLAEALAAGEAALAAGNSAEAEEQFRLATAIDEDNPRAAAGLERAGALGEVLALMQSGREAEQAGRTREALERYRAARDADPAYTRAGEAIARVERAQAASRYQQAMSRGFRELDQGRTDAAREAFKQAERLRPGAAGPRDALAQVAVLQRNEEIGSLRNAAREAEANEQWQRAVDQYQQALDIDSSLVFAREGIERARQRAQLSARMDLLIREPLRMYDNTVYNEARAVLAQARLIGDPGPVLTRQVTALEAQIGVARTPVTVELRSDSQTSVVIYKVGELGRFDTRNVGLIPGRYTAVGQRQGFRDVRKEFVVEAGSPPAPVTVICEERV